MLPSRPSPLPPSCFVPLIGHLFLQSIFFPSGNMQDRNTEEDLANVERVFGVLAKGIRLSA